MIDSNENVSSVNETTEDTTSVSVPEVEVVAGDESSSQKLKSNSSEINFQALRDKTDKIKRERDDYARIIMDYEKKIADQKKSTVSEDEEINLSDDEFVEGKHLSKVGKKIKRLEKQLKNYEAKTDNMATENRLKSQYSDFDSVVCKENIEILKNSHPEIANTLATSPDLYSAGVTAYTFIKNMGIGKPDAYEKDKERAHINSSKPRTLTSISPQQGDSPLSHANAFANGLTDDLKKKLLREMEDCRKSF